MKNNASQAFPFVGRKLILCISCPKRQFFVIFIVVFNSRFALHLYTIKLLHYFQIPYLIHEYKTVKLSANAP